MATNPQAELEVPGEPGVYWCARHSNVKTRLRCGRCETPICPKCTVIGPVGARCRDCTSNRTAHIYQINPSQYAVAFLVALALSALAAAVVKIGLFGLFVLFYAPVIGTLIGKAVSVVIKGKRGTPLAVVAGAGVVLGALIPVWRVLQLLSGGGSFSTAALLSNIAWPYVLIYLLLSLPAVWWWLK